jgi:hypothetical protein
MSDRTHCKWPIKELIRRLKESKSDWDVPKGRPTPLERDAAYALEAANERIAELEAAASKALKEQDELDEHHSSACMNCTFLDHSQHQCGLCDLREALKEETTDE